MFIFELCETAMSVPEGGGRMRNRTVSVFERPLRPRTNRDSIITRRRLTERQKGEAMPEVRSLVLNAVCYGQATLKLRRETAQKGRGPS